MKSQRHEQKNSEQADLREQGLRILARIIARAYLRTIRDENNPQSQLHDEFMHETGEGDER